MKRIVICGAGEVGSHTAEVLSAEGYGVTIIDQSTEKLLAVEERIDVRSVHGSACHPQSLREADVEDCDAIIAATNSDEVNLLTGTLGKRMGAKKAISRIHNRAYFKNTKMDLKQYFDIDLLICPEQLTSMAITANLTDPGVMEIESFANNQIEMHRYQVSTESNCIGPKLCNLTLPRGMRIAVISREGRPFIPDADTMMQEGDIVTILGRPDQFLEVKHLFHKVRKDNRRVAIMGGTSMGEWLAIDLLRQGYNVRLFETDRERAIYLAKNYRSLTVLNSDPIDPDEFLSEHLEQCSAFISATDDDEHNILASLQAKQLGSRLTSAVIHSPKFIHLLTSLGIDLPFSPRIVAAKALLKIVDDSPARRIAILAEGIAEVYEVGPVSAGAKSAAPIRETGLQRGSFIAAIQRNADTIVPTLEDRVMANDHLVVIAPPGQEKQLKKMFIDN